MKEQGAIPGFEFIPYNPEPVLIVAGPTGLIGTKPRDRSSTVPLSPSLPVAPARQAGANEFGVHDMTEAEPMTNARLLDTFKNQLKTLSPCLKSIE